MTKASEQRKHRTNSTHLRTIARIAAVAVVSIEVFEVHQLDLHRGRRESLLGGVAIRRRVLRRGLEDGVLATSG